MMRMLDGVNGLSLTSEILLQELSRTIEDAQKEAFQDRHKVFGPQGQKEFSQHLIAKYVSTGAVWVADPQWLTILSILACFPKAYRSRHDSRLRRVFPEHHMETPSCIEDFMVHHELLDGDSESLEWQDVAVAILKALDAEYGHRGLKEYVALTDDGKKLDPEETRLRSFLYNTLLVVNAFSIMMVVDGPRAVAKFREQFSEDDLDNLSKIHATIGGYRISMQPDLRSNLRAFVKKFLAPRPWATHSVAIALAKLGFFVETREPLDAACQRWRSEFDFPRDSQQAQREGVEAVISVAGLSVKLGEPGPFRDRNPQAYVYRNEYVRLSKESSASKWASSSLSYANIRGYGGRYENSGGVTIKRDFLSWSDTWLVLDALMQDCCRLKFDVDPD
jgi:hypothetical protein